MATLSPLSSPPVPLSPASPACAAARPVRRGRLRLTARGRLVVLVAVLLLGTVGFSLGRASASAPAGPSTPLASTVVRVGDTLWSVAGRVAPHRDPRSEIARIVGVNHLGSDTLTPGQRLLLPR